ncbi:MAG: ATPase [Oscillospiraceae bacterium]|nr:ATPase [Oscillospiraceae bacterium]
MKQSYYLGGTSPTGFKSKFIRQIRKPDYYTYMLKGGPGTGKSTLMKKIANEFDDDECELYYCSSDTKSLDAVVLTKKKIIVVDATAPHVFDPEIPGVSQEIINLGSFWNRDLLSSHDAAVRYYFEENAKYHAKAKRYVQAFASLNSNIYSIAENAVNKNKLDAFISRLTSKLFPKPNNEKSPCSIDYKQLSALTSFGYQTQEIADFYTVYTLNDDYFAGSDYFLRKIAERACECGLSITISESNMLNDTIFEHALIPELGIAFISSNFFNDRKSENSPEINFSRFYDKSALSLKKTHLSFDKKAVTELCSEAAEAIDTALRIHDELEKFYIESLDINKLNEFTENLIQSII